MHHARETLKGSGYRLTPQRTAIWEALRRESRHMTADEVMESVRDSLPGVNLSTVYRTLELLVRLDLVTETKLGSATSRFEVAAEPVHHHLVCERCGAVGHFGEDVLGPVYEAVAARDGFVARRARATLFGVCDACRQAEAQ